MTISEDRVCCQDCGRQVFPKLLALEFEAPLACGHPQTYWAWPCLCGAVASKAAVRCPLCVGAKPPTPDRG